ncbi:uncharacterized protein LOC142981364 [Anticarsia gemmatalis]|uniref:uncharacterized protein LOC142981364 n=1 Tax=Anticarsia gemmatalis TaxID=129554 RepID=UPI003F76D625
MADTEEGVPRLVTEKQILCKILKLYKDNTLLWDCSNKLFFNRQAKHDCYESMLTLWRQLDPGGTVYSLKKKLEHMRASYRRERKKVEYYSEIETVYVPNLWYYPYLTFLSGDKDEPTDEKKGTESNDEIEDTNDEPPEKKPKASPEEVLIETTETEEESCSDKYEEKWDDPGYVSLYAETIARQMKELDKQDRYNVERIISDVIYRARMGLLPQYSPQVVDSIVIPDTGPSWYEIDAQNSERPLQAACVKIENEGQAFNTEYEDQTVKSEYNSDEEP